ncbi:hypothetical protein [Streptomyces sp. NPDC008121]|uniref:hypothetical protein n=1 Tax=Streptomyces sp. NPDC008121 TaxID=3364809 RepID=UPI0036E211A1
MKFPKRLLAVPVAALAVMAGITAFAPASYAHSTQETFRGTAVSESEAHLMALNKLIEFEEKNSQECHQLQYRSFQTPDQPPTRLSGLWQYYITASCQSGDTIILENLTRKTIKMFPSGGEISVLTLTSAPQVDGSGEYFAYDTARGRLVPIVTGMDVPEFSVQDWESVAISIPGPDEAVEVRYGSSESPEDGQRVASAHY